MSDVNVPLLRKAVEWVEEQAALPDVDREWNQEFWYLPAGSHFAETGCGTTYCVAGYVALVSGWKPFDFHMAEDELSKQVVDVPLIARQLLGIDLFQAEELFRAYNTAADVRGVAEAIAGEAL